MKDIQRLKFRQGIVEIERVKPEFEDSRGWIISAANGSSEPTQLFQPRLISTQAHQIRGNHFHRHETETIIFFNGIWQTIFATSKGDNKQRLKIDCNQTPIKLVIPPLIAHAFLNHNNTVSYLYHYSDVPYSNSRSIPITLLES